MHSAAIAPAPAVISSASVRPRRGAAPAVISASGRPRRGARGAVRCEVVSSSAPSAAALQAAKWAQRTVVLPPQRRGCHLITPKIVNEIKDDLAEFKCGMAHFFLQHTSASLTINENYDSDVQADTETFLSHIVPEGPSAPWRHTMEGPDDMPAHIKSSMFGCSLTVPITNGRLNMGTWQSIMTTLLKGGCRILNAATLCAWWLKISGMVDIPLKPRLNSPVDLGRVHHITHKSLVNVKKHFEWHSPPHPV